jgi:site-specific DNA-methyltransferase (adenine-specific)
MVFENISFRDKFGEERKLEFNNFYCVDCMGVLKLMPDKSIDLCIVDPPYGIGISENPVRQAHAKKQWDKNVPPNEYFKELFRVSKNQVIWGGNYFDLPPTQNYIVWDKVQPHDFSLAMCELAWCSIQKPIKMFTYSVLRERNKIHPTQKPVALYKWLLTNYANKGDKILDTHVGSASSLIACHELGFDYIGFEIDEDYYNSAQERLEAVKAQISLFDAL